MSRLSHRFFSQAARQATSAASPTKIAIHYSPARQFTDLSPNVSDHRAFVSEQNSQRYFGMNMLKECRVGNNAFDISETPEEYKKRVQGVSENIGDIAVKNPMNFFGIEEAVLPQDIDVIADNLGGAIQQQDENRRWQFYMNDHGLMSIAGAQFSMHDHFMYQLEARKIGRNTMDKHCQVLTDGQSQMILHLHAPLSHSKEYIRVLAEMMFDRVLQHCVNEQAIKNCVMLGDFNANFEETKKIVEEVWRKKCAEYKAKHHCELPCELIAHGDISEQGHLHSGKLVTADAVWHFEFKPAVEPKATVHRRSVREIIALLISAGMLCLENSTLEEAGLAALTTPARGLFC